MEKLKGRNLGAARALAGYRGRALLGGLRRAWPLLGEEKNFETVDEFDGLIFIKQEIVQLPNAYKVEVYQLSWILCC